MSEPIRALETIWSTATIQCVINLGLRKVKWFVPIHTENQGQSWDWNADHLAPKPLFHVSSPRHLPQPAHTEAILSPPHQCKVFPNASLHPWFCICIITSWSQWVSHPNSNGQPFNGGMLAFSLLMPHWLEHHCWHVVDAEWALANLLVKGFDAGLARSSLLFHPMYYLWVNVSPRQDLLFNPTSYFPGH